MLGFRKWFLFVLALLVVFSVSFSWSTRAESEGLILEGEKHWETYGVGGTCNFGTHNFFVGDVDGDGVIEMVTGGITYNISGGVRSEVEAPLRIWNWKSGDFTLEKGYNWAGVIRSIYAADVNEDGLKEIITGGRVTNKTGSYPSLRIWSWDGETLDLKGSYGGVYIRSIFAADVDKEEGVEVLTGGRSSEDANSSAQLCVWQWKGGHLVLRESVEWGAAEGASANSVYAYDLNHDGKMEVITGGYNHGLMGSKGEICIWHWEDEEFSRKEEEEWCMKEGEGASFAGNPFGNTLVNNLKVGDVDEDGTAEIVTGGFTYDGEKINAELRIWNWHNHILSLEEKHQWATEDITEIKALALDDVNGDGKTEVVTSGNTASYAGFSDEGDTPPETAQLRIWNWNGEKLTLKKEESWQVGEGVCPWNVATGDVDQDGVVEIVTVGCMHMSNLCDPDLRIWSMPEKSPSILYPFLAILAVATALVVTFLFIRKRLK